MALDIGVHGVRADRRRANNIWGKLRNIHHLYQIISRGSGTI